MDKIERPEMTVGTIGCFLFLLAIAVIFVIVVTAT